MKLTKKQAFEMLLALSEVNNNPELVEFIQHEISLLDKRVATKSGKVNAEHNLIMTAILESLTLDGCSIKELQAKNSLLAEYSNQKLSAILKKMVDNGTVVRVKLKNATIFKLA